MEICFYIINKGRCMMEKYNIDEMIRKVCTIKVKNNMERTEGLHDDVYAKISEESAKGGNIFNRSNREKR